MSNYVNYHCHSHYSNAITPDVVIRNEDRAKRVVELGMSVLSGIEHGWTGRVIEIYQLAKQYGIKPLFGTEAYFVIDRHDKKDKTNSHLIILAKNENGRKAINRILSEANVTGYYYKARVDLDLLLTLPKDDVWLTSACLGGIWKYDNYEEIFSQIISYFGENFFFEVQTHPVEQQKEINRKVLELSKKYNVKYVAGMDSHIIHPEQKKDRDEYLKSRGIVYEDESGWLVDFPSYEVAFSRFQEQGVLSDDEIETALQNTNIFETVEEYHSVIFDKNIKLPSLYKNESQEQRNKRLENLVNEKWNSEKIKVPFSKWPTYEEEIKKELDVVWKTNIADYFLLDYEIIKHAKEIGGQLTLTGRGCFTEDSLVVTTDGIKKIKDVVIGDNVINEKGNIVPIYNTMNYEIREDLVQIEHVYGTNKNFPMVCTKDHKILINRNGNVSWIEAQNMRIGDYVCNPKIKIENNSAEYIDLNEYNSYFEYDENYIYEVNSNVGIEYEYSPSSMAKRYGVGKSSFEKFANGEERCFSRKVSVIDRFFSETPFKNQKEYVEYIKNKRTKKVKRFLKNDVLFNTFIGLMYGDGFTLKKNSSGVGLAINSLTKKDLKNRDVFNKIAKRLNVDVYENKSKTKNLIQLYIGSIVFRNYFEKNIFISKKGKEKKFNPNLFEQAAENLKAIKNGLMMADGSINKNKKERDSFDNTSKSIIGAFKILSMATGESPVSLIFRKSHFDSRGYKNKDSYKLKISKNPKTLKKSNLRCFEDEQYWYLPVTNVSIVKNKKTKVYDLSVLGGSHSYVINNMVVHNSAPSYYLCKLLGFTTIDRISAEVKLFPERFISAERLLEAKSLPDIDLNCGNPEVFAQAQEDILGVGHSYKMIAFGKVKELKSWKMYSRQAGIDFEVANMVSSQIKEFEEALKYADEDDKDKIVVEDYLSIEHMELFNEGKKFLDLVDTLNPHPCAYGIFDDGDMREEFGIIKIKENICVCLDGKWAEDYKMLKNDLLKVQVVELIYETYKKIGIEPHPLPELISMCNRDKKVWDVYSKGMTVSVNQFEKESTSKKGMSYAPKNISEISAFVAAIRPGFKSEYSHFASRGKFDYGVKSLDEILQTDEFPYSYMLYQENSMAVMGWSGIPMYQTYEIVKAIAKKRYKDVLKNKEMFIEGMKNRLIKTEKMVDKNAKEISDKTWKIIEDSAFYQFNASHSYSVAGDSLYCAWLKTNHPIHFYETFIKMMEKDGDKERMELAKQEAIKFFGINFPHPEFGQDNRNIIAIPERNEITQSLNIYKGFGDSIGESMYKLGTEFKDGDFLDLLIFAEENGTMSSKIETLIKLNYFSKFGKNKKLHNIFTEFRKGKSKYTSKLADKSKAKRKDNLRVMFEEMKDESFSNMEQIANEVSILGRLETKFSQLKNRYGFVVSLEVGEKGSPKAMVQSLRLGNIEQFKVSRNIFMKNEFSEGQILLLPDGGIEKKNSKRPTGKLDAKGKLEFEDIPEKFDFWITNYSTVNALLI